MVRFDEERRYTRNKLRGLDRALSRPEEQSTRYFCTSG